MPRTRSPHAGASPRGRLDVGAVVLTGGVARAGPPFLDRVRRHAREMDWTCLPCRADRVVLGSVAHAGCVGAVSYTHLTLPTKA